jgi:hypothetical protein
VLLESGAACMSCEDERFVPGNANNHKKGRSENSGLRGKNARQIMAFGRKTWRKFEPHGEP